MPKPGCKFDNADIRIGQARIVYAPSLVDRDTGQILQLEGWCLPGGRRTLNSDVAYQAAVAMNTLMEGPST